MRGELEHRVRECFNVEPIVKQPLELVVAERYLPFFANDSDSIGGCVEELDKNFSSFGVCEVHNELFFLNLFEKGENDDKEGQHIPRLGNEVSHTEFLVVADNRIEKSEY